jgi:hypothetical protein
MEELLRLGGTAIAVFEIYGYTHKIYDSVKHRKDYESKEALIFSLLPWPFDWIYANKKFDGHCHPITPASQEAL